jgi:outer membrane murein-binding lipoprotein Lpp
MKRAILSAAIAAALLSGCTNNGTDTNELKKQIDQQKETIEQLKQENEALTKKMSSFEENVKENALSVALAVVAALKAKDMNLFAQYVDPEKGVRFSPYGHVDVKNDVVFQRNELPALFESSDIRRFGTFDGSGEPIEMTFRDYFNKFVYDVDFANPQMIGNNVVIGKGNTLHNIPQVYPNAVFVEFHFAGFDRQYEGMDWRSLRVVLEKQNGTWYVVGIVHDQWTT